MYNGIGLQTPRGSGTNGYVMRNMAVLRHHETAEERAAAWDVAPPKHREPDQGILEHERKRQVEVKCLELRLELEDKEFDEDIIEKEVDALREKLLASLEKKATAMNAKSLKASDTHALAAAKRMEIDKMASALGMRLDYTEGDAFNREKQEEERMKRMTEREERERHREEERARYADQKAKWEAERKERDRLRRREEDRMRQNREVQREREFRDRERNRDVRDLDRERMPPPPIPPRGNARDSFTRRSRSPRRDGTRAKEPTDYRSRRSPPARRYSRSPSPVPRGRPVTRSPSPRTRREIPHSRSPSPPVRRGRAASRSASPPVRRGRPSSRSMSPSRSPSSHDRTPPRRRSDWQNLSRSRSPPPTRFRGRLSRSRSKTESSLSRSPSHSRGGQSPRGRKRAASSSPSRSPASRKRERSRSQSSDSSMSVSSTDSR